MLACQGSPRDKYTDVFFNIGSPSLLLPSVSGATLSRLLFGLPSVLTKPFVLCPIFWARSNYIHLPFSVKGISKTRFFLFSYIRALFFCLPVADSEGLLLPKQLIESRCICEIWNILRLKYSIL